HRYALREEECRHQVALLPIAEGDDLGGIGRPFGPTVPAPVFVGAVAVVLAIGFVVLGIVADEILEREAIVAGHEVDAGVRLTSIILVEVAGAAEAGGELVDQSPFALPEAPDAVAILAIPLGPEDRKIADLVAARADIPGFGDQLDLGDRRVLVDDVEKGAEAVDLVKLPGQRARQVETEAVDVHLRDPVAKAVHNKLENARM